jgi:hypothetical protein
VRGGVPAGTVTRTTTSVEPPYGARVTSESGVAASAAKTCTGHPRDEDAVNASVLSWAVLLVMVWRYSTDVPGPAGRLLGGATSRGGRTVTVS